MTSAETPRTAVSSSSGDRPTATSTSKPAAVSVSIATWASGSVMSTREAMAGKANPTIATVSQQARGLGDVPRRNPPTRRFARLPSGAMPRRPTPAPVRALLCLVTLTLLAPAGAGPAGAQTAPPPGAAPAAKAWLLADADTGKVLDAFNEHEALPPASTQKVMTALVAAEKLPRDARVNVGPTAAAQPAMKIGMTEGEQWALHDTLHSLMMVSANDAAYALAEAA